MIKDNFLFDISLDSLTLLKSTLNGEGIDSNKLDDIIDKKYGTQKEFARIMKEKHGKIVEGRKISLFSGSVVSRALSGENSDLTTKLLLYILVEHNLIYTDFIKGKDETEKLQEKIQALTKERDYHKKKGNYYKKLNNLHTNIASIEPENRISKAILALQSNF